MDIISRNINIEENSVGLALDTTLQSTNTSLGTDGATPPSIIGTGIRGWLRAIYEKLLGTINVNTGDKGATASVTSIAQSATSVSLVSANTSRKQVIIFNTASKNLWVSYVTPAVVGKGYKLAKDESFIEDKYTGAIYGIWDGTGTNNAQITDVTL